MKSVSEVDAWPPRRTPGRPTRSASPTSRTCAPSPPASPPGDNLLVMAGLLHDIMEDTDWTAERLREAGIPARVVEIVEVVTSTFIWVRAVLLQVKLMWLCQGR